MSGGKGGGSAHVPYEAPNTLYSKQQVKVLDVLSEGPVEGLSNGNANPFKSIFFDDTPVQAKDGSYNFFGFHLVMTTGEKDQTYLPGFDVVEKTRQVNADVKRDTPITRSITDSNVSSTRVTVGVKGLVRSKDNGDRVETSVSLLASLLKNGNIHSSQTVTINEKGTEPFYQDATFKELPEAPFDVRVTRLTPDSNSDKLQNATIFPSFVESIDAKLSYKYLAMAGYKFDAQQFGSSLPRINTLMKLLIVSVPTNYDPINRTYTGLWDGSFKKAWTDNPAWVIYDFATNKRYGGALDPRYINRAALYRLSQFCDELVDDGYGGKEPRVRFNAFYTTAKKFDERLQDMASACFGLAHWDGQYLTFTLDRDDDPVAIYTNANVIDGNFSYEGISHNAVVTDVHVQYNDAKDAYRQKIEVVEDIDLLRRYPRNTRKVVAEGCTSKSQAHRMGRYILEKSRLQKLVSFAVGREGLRHRPHDVIQIADIHAAGANIGGRIIEVNGNAVTLDREVEKVKGAIFSYVGEKDGKLMRIETAVVSQKDDFTLILKDVTDDIKEYTVFNIARADVKPKYYRALGISNNGDGTYSIKAVEHEMGLQDRIAAGIKFEDSPNSIWTSYPEITNGTVGNNGDEVIITWDNINADTTALTYTVKLYQDGVLYRTYPDLKEPILKFDNLPSGKYVAEIQARNSRGQLSNILKQYFDLDYTITALTTKSELFSVKIGWKLPTIVNTSVSTEIWRAEKNNINDARLLVTLPYPQSEYIDPNMSVGEKYYYWARIIDKNDTTGEFTRSMFGEPKTDPSDILEILDGKISEKQISKDLQDQFDKSIDDRVDDAKKEIQKEIDGIEVDLTGINSEIDNIKTDITSINSELDAVDVGLTSINSEIETVKTDAGKALKDAEKNAKDIKDQTKVIDEVKVQSETSEALWQLAQMSNISAQRSEFARSMSMSGQVGKNIANIEELYSFRVTDQEAVAFEFKQMNTRVDDAESKITETRESLSNEIKAEASKREALEAKFDVNTALQQLSSMAFATSDKSLSSRLFSLSASTANAHARYDALQEVVATNEEARVNSEQRLQAQIGTANADIQRIDRVMTSEFASQANTNSELSASIDKTSTALKEESEARVERDKAQAKKNEAIETSIEESKAIQQLASMSHSSAEKSFSQRHFMIAAQTANSSANIEELQKSYADLKVAWSVSETSLQSQIDNSKAEISRIDRTQVEQNSAQTIINNKQQSEINDNKSRYESLNKTVVDNEKSQVQQNEAFKTEFDDNKAFQQLSNMSESSSAHSLSQRYALLSAQSANSSAKIEELQKIFTDSNASWAISEKRLQSQIDTSRSELSRIEKVSNDRETAQAATNEKLNSEIGKNSAEINKANEAIVNNEKAQAVFKEDVKAKFDENEADATLSLISLAAEGVTRSQQNLMLSANLADAHAQIKETKIVIAEEKESQAAINTRIESKVDNNEAQIKTNAQTQATDKAALTQQIDSAHSKIGANEAEINKIKTTQVNDQKAISTLKSETSARFDKNEADQILENISLTTEGYSRASQYAVISVSVAGNSSSIQELSNTFSDFNGTMSEQITQLQSKSENHQSQITQIMSTQATTDGKVNALYTMKVEANGAMSGIMLGANEYGSMFKVMAGAFVVSTADDDKNLFIIQNVNGKDVASLNVNDFIIDGSLTAKKINAESFQGHTITGVEINAGKFYGGSIAIGGTKENPNCSINENGDFYAKNGRFEGTVYADKIEGDVVKHIALDAIEAPERVFKELKFIIPPENFQRIVSIYVPNFIAYITGTVGRDKGEYHAYMNGKRLYKGSSVSSGEVISMGVFVGETKKGESAVITLGGSWRAHYQSLGQVVITTSKGTLSENKWETLYS